MLFDFESIIKLSDYVCLGFCCNYRSNRFNCLQSEKPKYIQIVILLFSVFVSASKIANQANHFENKSNEMIYDKINQWTFFMFLLTCGIYLITHSKIQKNMYAFSVLFRQNKKKTSFYGNISKMLC